MMTKESLEKTFSRTFSSSGNNWKAKCPFHADGQERTPSFYVHKEEYVAQCFGCGASGYIHVLAGRFLGKSPEECQEALGITIIEQVQERLNRAREAVLERPPQRFSEALLAGWKKEIHAYTIKRGFTHQTLARAETRYDRDGARQVFPWRSQDGALRGATGRTVGDHPAKWKHYWEFDKGKWLYELPRSASSGEGDAQQRRAQVAGESQVSGELWRPTLVVEGIFDLLWVVQEGHYENVVAPVAARLTYDQAKQIRERTNHVIIAFDNDEAGIRGSARAYEQLKQTCVVEFVCWPDEAKDWMDLDGQRIQNILESTVGWAGWRTFLRRKGLDHLTESIRHTRSQERQVR